MIYYVMADNPELLLARALFSSYTSTIFSDTPEEVSNIITFRQLQEKLIINYTSLPFSSRMKEESEVKFPEVNLTSNKLIHIKVTEALALYVVNISTCCREQSKLREDKIYN